MVLRLQKQIYKEEEQNKQERAWTMTSVSFRGSLSKVRLRISLVPAA